MSNLQYNVKLDKLCTVLKLGEIIGVPEALPGGLLHRMYALETTQGKFAIKALNPQIMIRPTAMQNIINSEVISNIAAKKVPALPAMQFNGTSVQQLDNQCYLVFEWVEGRSLKPNEITKDHCEKIGEIMADIHMMDFSVLGTHENEANHPKSTDWIYYLKQGKMNNSVWINLLAEIIDQLDNWNDKANHAATLLAENTVISHGDLDSKNVLWNHGAPLLIDWEASGHKNPMQNLCETAVYWSGNETGGIDKDKFLAFIAGYKKKKYGTLQADWEVVLDVRLAGI